MHILFLTDNFPPEVNAPASRTHEHAKEWVELGHQVTVITCAPNFPAGRVFQGYKNKLWQSEYVDGIRVIRVWSYITPNEGFWKRTLDYISYMVTSFLASFFVRRADIVVGTSPQIFTAISAWAVAVVKRRPFVFELRDLWPDSIKVVGAIKSERILNWLEAVELFLYRRARIIISVTHSFKVNLIQRGIDAHKIHVVTNGVDTSRFMPASKDAELAISLGLSDSFVVGYIGTHGMSQRLGTVLDAAKFAQNSSDLQNVKFLFVGNGAEKNSLMDQASARGLENVHFVDTVPKQDVTRYWSILDVAVVHLKNDPLFQSVIPSKIFECMAMGVPILHGVSGESATIVSKAKVGLVVEAENPKALLDAIKGLVTNPTMREDFKENGPIAAVAFDRKVLAREMLTILESR